MADNIPGLDPGPEAEDTRSFDEKFRDVVEKIRPYLQKLWSNRKNFFLFNLVILIITVLYLLFLTKPYFNSSIEILPEYGSKTSMLSQLSGLASIAGVNVGDAVPTEIYQNLLYSEMVISNVVYAKYKTNEYPDSVNLIQYFNIENTDNDPQIRKRKDFLGAYELLTKGKITTDIDRVTKILNINVNMPEAQLSADVANRLAESLDLYIRTQRKSYATEQNFYLEKRTKQVKDSLTIAENQLKNFREQNRITVQSPNLLLEQGRLMRNVEILQNVFIELTKQLELAKLNLIKDAPVLNIKEYAKTPVVKAGPKRASSLILIMFFSIILSGLYFIFKDKLMEYYKILKG